MATKPERTIDARLAATYHEAMRASHGSARVEIHVGSDVWNRLCAMRPVDTPAPSTLSGFTILEEKAWEPNRIEVRAVRTIW